MAIRVLECRLHGPYLRAGSVARGRGVGFGPEAHFSTQARQLVLFLGGEHLELLEDRSQVVRKETLHVLLPCLGQCHLDMAAIIRMPLALDPAFLLELIHDQRDVRAGGEQLLAELTLEEGTEMEKSFQDPELALGQAQLEESMFQTSADRSPGAHQIDVRVERTDLIRLAAVTSSH